MSGKEREAIANRLFQDLQNLMIDLYVRWQDEGEYEDFEDYAIPIRPKVEGIGGQLVKMHRRPFGFDYILSGVTYRISVSSTQYAYRRVA